MTANPQGPVRVVPEALIKFLLGEGPWQGRDFGDKPPVTASGWPVRYWWRKDLRLLAAAPSPAAPEGVEEMQRLIEQIVNELVPDQGRSAPSTFGLAVQLQGLIKELAKEEDADECPVCAVAFNVGDRCALDIEMGTCHVECLEGAPIVDLDTGEPIEGGGLFTFIYGSDEPVPLADGGR